MNTDIGNMPLDSRIWIYQATKPLTEKEKAIIGEKLSSFVIKWKTHGSPLKASWNILYDRFLLLAVDEKYNSPSGCSIDESVHFLREIEKEMGIGFLEKSSVAILENTNEVKVFELKDLKKNVQEGRIKPETLIFNNLVPTLGELQQSWKIPASQSWLSRYFTN